MSSFVQRSSNSERSEAWRPVVAPSATRKYFTQSQGTNQQRNNKYASYATTASRLDETTSQTVKHSSHPNNNLPSKNVRRDILSSFHSASVSKSGGSASSSLATSPQQVSREEKKAAQARSIDLSKTTSYQKKPPILSPKPKTIDKFSPIGSSCRSRTISEERFKATQADLSSDSYLKEAGINRVNANNNNKRPVTTIRSFRDRSQSAEEESVDIKPVQVGNEKVKSNQKVRRSQTLPRLGNNLEDARKQFMEQKKLEKQQKNLEKMSLKNRPKVAAKPKLSLWNSKENRVKIENKKTSDDDVFSDSLAAAPFSDMRSKFEEMKLNFKKPVPDPEHQTERREIKKTSGTTAANQLFKDILEMKSLDNFDPTFSQTNKEIMEPASANKLNEQFLVQPKQEKVASSPNISHIYNKKEKGFCSEERKENKNQFSEKSLENNCKTINPSFLNNNCSNNFTGSYNPSDVPAPVSPTRADLMQIEFMDLPPPPVFPQEISEENSFASDDVDKNLSTTHLERNAVSNGDTVFYHSDKLIASGLDSTHKQTAMSNHNFSRGDVDKSKHSGNVLKSENPFTEANQCEIKRYEKEIGRDEKTLQPKTDFYAAEPYENDDQSNVTSLQSRDFDEEILYYDNMDIMEKVRLKREQDEKRLYELSKHEENSSLQSGFLRNNHSNKKSSNSIKASRLFNNSSGSNSNRSREESSSNDDNGQIELNNSLGNLESEYLKLKENLNQDKSVQNPPKLPPKQRKFNRKLAIENADKQVSTASEQASGVAKAPSTVTNTNPLRLQISGPISQSKPHIATPVPLQQATSVFNNLPLHQNQQALPNPPPPPVRQSSQQQHPKQQQQPQQNIHAAQFSPEDARARQLVDEPLAPILEEDSTYGDSSSCTSSLQGDDLSVFDDTSSVQSTRTLDDSKPHFLLSNVRKQELLYSDEQDEGSESTLAGIDSALSTGSTDDVSDTSSVQWKDNPLQSNKAKTISQSNFVSVSKETSKQPKISPKREDFHNDGKSLQNVLDNRSLETSETETKSSSSSQRHSLSSRADDLIDDVEPYGMVDLTNLQPKFSEILSKNPHRISNNSESELTPSSIMYSVNQFNATHSKSPTKSRHFSFDSTNDPNDMPNFPLDVEVKKLSKKKEANRANSFRQHQRNKSDGDRLFEEEQPGYDNLENYGGAARAEAEKKKLMEASLPEKSQLKRETSKHQTRNRNASPSDTLATESGLAKQAARSRASFPLPVTESMLARHSSAVRAVDRHSGNLKRAKESGVLKSFAESSNEQQFQQQQDLSRQPRLEQNPISTSTNRSKLGLSFDKSGSIKSSIRYSGSAAEFDEATDDGVVNPYEEVPFLIDGEMHKSQTIISAKPDTPEQEQAKTKVKEILDNIKPPDSPYRPKPPMPRYPVDYDNFYLGKNNQSNNSKSKDSFNQIKNPKPSSNNSQATSPASPPVLSSAERRKASISSSSLNTTPCSTPASVRAANFAKSSLKTASSDNNENALTDENDSNARSEGNSQPQNNNQSIGSQLRYFLGGGQDSKHSSPGVPRKKSILKRSKSPGGSKRSKSPSKSFTSDNHSVTSDDMSRISKNNSNDNTSKAESGKSSESESRDQVQVHRSASQRLVERRGRLASQKSKTSEDESSEHTLQRRKKGTVDKLRMSSRWRRSKSQDRESPTRSKSKERKFFGRRSKSQERPDKDYKSKDDELEEEERGRKSKSLRRSRSSSRKRDKRGRSSDRSEDGNSSGGRGRNPVRFIKKLLGHKKSTDGDIEIVHLTPEKGGDVSDSTEALSTILAYKADEGSEKEDWNLPRPNPPQQKLVKPNNSTKTNSAAKSNKALRSPPSHRAKKFSSALASNKVKTDLSTGSSSEGIDKRRQDKLLSGQSENNSYPTKPTRTQSRKSSFSNSIPSSDSEQLGKQEKKIKEEKLSVLKEQLQLGRHSLPLKAGLRRNILTRDYDSDTATSVIPSDADSSGSLHSDLNSDNRIGAKSELKTGKELVEEKQNKYRTQRSKSDPSLFVPGSESAEDNKNTRHNVEETKKSQTTSTTVEKKRPSKVPPHKRRNQKQARRQTAPVDLAYEAHQRQKYKTLVSLNAQTLRKVTEKWLSEWRNQLPVGGFLITSWSDVALTSHRPLCMIANSVVYGAVSTGSKRFHLACQLYDHADVDDKMTRKLDNCSSLPAHPNTCGVCSHFNCRVPRSLLDPSSGGGAADTVCVVLTTRPYLSLQDFLDSFARKNETAEFYRQLLINLLQLLQGINHLKSSGFDLPYITPEHLIITEDRGFLQILPHLQFSEQKIGSQGNRRTSLQSFDSNYNSESSQFSTTQQVGRLARGFLQNCPAPDHGSTTTSGNESSTKYFSAIKQIVNYFELTPMLHVREAAQIVQCALWGPDNLDDVGVDDVTPYAALELWIEMEQAKLVNSLAVLATNDRLIPSSFFKHQFFATVSPQPLFNSLKALQRI